MVVNCRICALTNCSFLCKQEEGSVYDLVIASQCNNDLLVGIANYGPIFLSAELSLVQCIFVLTQRFLYYSFCGVTWPITRRLALRLS
jgi:hypothetical protein